MKTYDNALHNIMQKHKVKQERGVQHIHHKVIHMLTAVLSTYKSLTPSNLISGHLWKHFFRLSHTYQQVLRSVQVQKLRTTGLVACEYEVQCNTEGLYCGKLYKK
jgi:hypothetical protein